MSSDYEWARSRQAAERIIHLPSKERRSLFDALDKIAEVPEAESPPTFKGDDGQNYYIRSFKNRIITYRFDHAFKRVDILAIE